MQWPKASSSARRRGRNQIADRIRSQTVTVPCRPHLPVGMPPFALVGARGRLARESGEIRQLLRRAATSWCHTLMAE